MYMFDQENNFVVIFFDSISLLSSFFPCHHQVILIILCQCFLMVSYTYCYSSVSISVFVLILLTVVVDGLLMIDDVHEVFLI